MKYIWAPLNALNGSINLAFTSSFFGGNEATIKSTFSVFDYTDINYTESGNSATIKAKNSEGEDSTFVLKYDKNSKTAELTIISADSTTVISLYLDDDVYAKTYFNGSSATELYAKSENIKISYGDTNSAPKSLYGDASRINSDDFASTYNTTLIVENGTVK